MIKKFPSPSNEVSVSMVSVIFSPCPISTSLFSNSVTFLFFMFIALIFKMPFSFSCPLFSMIRGLPTYSVVPSLSNLSNHHLLLTVKFIILNLEHLERRVLFYTDPSFCNTFPHRYSSVCKLRKYSAHLLLSLACNSSKSSV